MIRSSGSPARVLALARRGAAWFRFEGSEPIPPYIRSILADAERRSEVFLAYLRLAALIVLVALLRVFEFFPNDRVVLVSIVIYGVATGAAILLAWRHFYRPWLPWVFTTLDVALVIGYVAVLTRDTGLTTAAAFSAPGGMMIFLFMAHAAVRYRPSLVLYTAGLFLLGWLFFDFIAGTTPEPGQSHLMFEQEWARVAVTLLTAGTLLVITVRTRALLLASIRDAYLRTSIARFVPSTLVAEFARRGDEAAACQQHAVAVLFADLRGFTAATERLPAVDVLRFLNEYRRRMVEVIAAHDGMVDKFIGDAIMVVFGVPRLRPDDASRAVTCALAMLAAVEAWNRERTEVAWGRVRIGIGAHHGEVIVGAIGDERRLEYTVIGDTVNAAQRIERLCAELGLPLLVSAELLRAAAIPERRWHPISPQNVRGRQRPLRLFAPSPVHPENEGHGLRSDDRPTDAAVPEEREDGQSSASDLQGRRSRRFNAGDS